MIIAEKLEETYEACTIRSLIWLRCDYCGKEFQRIKKSRERLNKIVAKDSCGDKQCKATKKQEINLLLYGSANLFQSEHFKQKQRQTNLEKYGTEEYFDSGDFRTKRRARLIERFGVENPLQSSEIREKQTKTCIERYGVSNYAQVPDFGSKRSETVQEKYGVGHVMQRPEVLAKRKATSVERYGVENYTQTEEYADRRKQTCLERYGVDHPSKVKENREKARRTTQERYGADNYSKTEESKKRYRDFCLEKYGVPNPLCLQQNQRYGKSQIAIRDWLNSLGFGFTNNYTILDGREIDLYDDNLKLGIEYCGLFWHTELSPNPRMKDYHYEKYRRCQEHGVRLLTIFEDEWKTKKAQCQGVLRAVLGSFDQTVYARKAQVETCSRAEFNTFCNQFHVQGGNNLGLAFFVLKYQGEIVGGMSLGRHHRGKAVLTLDRLCFKSGVRAVGGAGKLFHQCKAWARDNGYQEVISWSDNRWSEGNVYKSLGFTLDKELGPDYSYVALNCPKSRLSKQSQKKSNTGCPADVTEREWAIQSGLARIWDCGKKRWIFKV